MSSSTSSAEEMHARVVEAHRVGNRGRLVLIQSLRIIHESGMYQQLGFPSIAAYGDRHFGFGRAETYDFVRVATALDELPRCLEAFAEGRLCWSALREITRVASGETEGSWLEFATEHPAARLRAEVREARDKKRDAPRKEGYGMPALMQTMTLRFSPSEGEKVRGLLRRFGKQAAEKMGEEDVSAEQALVYLAERFLAVGGDLEERLDEGRAAEYALVYQTCPSCQRAGVHTRDGLVEVGRQEIERIEGEAVVEHVSRGAAAAEFDAGLAPAIDRPTPSWMARQVHRRDGERCTNPYCSSTSDQCHHIVFRSEGGRTMPEMLTSVCGRCHALIHAGLLKVSHVEAMAGADAGAGARAGMPGQELVWETCSESFAAVLSTASVTADSLPVFRIESTRVVSAMGNDLGVDHGEEALSALANLGMSKAEASMRVRKAGELLGPGPRSLEDVILAAMSGRVRRFGREFFNGLLALK